VPALRSADLSESYGVRYAQVTFTTHGERGRMLTACEIAGEVKLFCGCFIGSLEELQAYIDKGEENLKPSRNFALKCVMEMLNFPTK
jgi:hypothetical protein